MKVLLVNGSPHKNGSTQAALNEITKILQQEKIDTEVFWIGANPIKGCTGCGVCKANGKCITDDVVNRFLEKTEETDGFIFGSPVHFASASGAMTSFMDRVFYANLRGNNDRFYLKPAASIVTARRAGTTATLDHLNKYIQYAQMPMISSRYWNMVHGSSPEEVAQDLEGLQIMRVLARNMAWFLKLKELGLKHGIDYPEREETIYTNFI